MSIFTRALHLALVITLTTFFAPSVQGQSVMDPNDPVNNYNSASPPSQPAWGAIGKWARTPQNFWWNTNNYKCYIYNGQAFRLRFPQSYNPAAADGKKYPIMIFFHGAGERGPISDNELQLFNGGDVFDAAVTNGTFDGYVLCMQSPSGFWGQPVFDYMAQIMDYMIANNKVDPFRITVNGLSAGGEGTWLMTQNYPAYAAAAVPMSNATTAYISDTSFLKFTPIWLVQGGKDLSPDSATARAVANAYSAAGANFTYLLFPQDGHDTWNDTWAQPNFWPYMNNAYMSNPYPLFGRTQFCPGDAVNVTIGLVPGLQAYQWRLNGTVINGATSNTITATQVGTYDARVQRNGVWSDWSHTPVVISMKQPTAAPTITIPPLTSNVIPALDTSHGITLQAPAGYASYAWQQVGNSTVLGTASSYYTTTPGSYTVMVTERYGCSSASSSPFTVVNANGANKPSPAAALTVSPASPSSLRLDWTVNPSQQYPQTGFEVYQATQSGGPYKIVALMGAAAAYDTVTGLNPGGKYYFVVRAVNGAGAAAASNEASGVTSSDTIPPTAPGNLAVTGTSRNSVSLNWTAATDNVGVTSYDIYVNGIKRSSTTGTSFTVYNLQFGQTYTFSVTARDFARNISPFSNQVVAQPLLIGYHYNYYTFTGTWNSLPNLTTLTPVKSGYSTSLNLTNRTQDVNFAYLWEGFLHVPTTGVYYFRTNSDDGSTLYLGSNGQLTSAYNYPNTPLVNNDGLHSSQDATSNPVTLTAGVYPIAIAYYQQAGGFGISASWSTPQTGVGNFVPIPLSALTDAATVNGQPPAAPSNLAATAQSYNKISLSWVDHSNNETAYEVWRATDSLGSTLITIATIKPNSTSYTDNTANPGTRYYYRVRAIGQYGQSAFDNAGPPFASATTPALPPVPAAPTGLVARGTSTPSTVTVRWTNNATNATNYQVYRSSGGNTNYLPLTTLAATAVSYKDTGLFANSVYYYKVRAVNAGGNSAFSNEDSAHTGNYPPVLVPLPSAQYMRYGTQLQLQVQATDSDGDALTIQVTNLPAFGAFVSTGNGTGTITFSPAQKDSGVYNNITVTVTDANGASASTSFSLTVNNNYPPVITRPVNNVSVNMKQTATVNLSATDQSASYVLSWSFKGLPGFAAVTTNGGSATLNLSPGYADGGSYIVQARVDDGNHLFDTVSFTITVVPVPLPSTKVYVHFSDGSTGTVASAPWNNTAAVPVQNAAFPNLKDQNGSATGIGLTITSPWQSIGYGNGANNLGATTGNNSGVYPDVVLGSAYYTDGNTQTIKISGLDTAGRYNFTFLGSRGNVADDRTSVYSISGTYGNASVSLQAANNTSNTVTISNMRPNGDSTLTLTLQRGANAPYGYLNALMIEKPFDDHTKPAKPRNISGQIGSNNQLALTWIAAAYNAISYQVYKSQNRGGSYTLLNPGATNPTQSSYTDSVISENNTYYYYVTATNSYGVSPSSDTLTVVVPNLPPTLSAISNLTAQATKTTTVNVTATDAPGDTITLRASSLPGFATFQDNGNGTGTITFKPGNGDLGSYTGLTITATDKYGASSTTSFGVTVTFANMRNIYIHFNDGTAAEPAQGAPWNNMNSAPTAGAGIANLKDDQGTATGFGINLVDAWAGANNLGPTTGNNSGVYPDNVMQSFYYDNSGSTAPRHMNITGLSSRSAYNVIFYAGRGGVTDNRITHYTIGNQSVQLNAAGNTTQTVQINNVSADANGNIGITFTQDAGAAFGYINAIQLQYSYDTTFYAPSLTATSPNTTQIKLAWVSNNPSITTGFEIWRSSTPTGPFSLLATTGSTVTTYTDGGLSKGSAYFYEVRALAGSRQSAFSNIAGTSTVAYTVEIQFNDGSRNPPQGGVWNSTNSTPYPGLTVQNMINTLGQQTGMNLGVAGNFTGYNNLGATTGNNSGVYPDNVMQGFYYCDFGVTATLAVTGLDRTSTYNFNFFGSRANPATSVISTYQIGNQIVTQDATNNTSNVVQISGVKPDSTGTIYFSVYNTTNGRAYLNALTIDGVPGAISNFAQTPVATQAIRGNGNGQARIGSAGSVATGTGNGPNGSLAGTVAGTGETKVTAFPDPFVDRVSLNLELSRPVNKLLVLLVDASGRVLVREELHNLPQGRSIQGLDWNGSNLPVGSYFVILQGLPDGQGRTIPMIKVSK